MATFKTGASSLFIEPKTTIKITGNNSAKTIEVGLRSVASRLNLEMVNAERTGRG